MIIMPTPSGVPMFIPTGGSSRNSKPKPEPKCPHCKKTLKGWSKPDKSDNAVLEILSIFLVVLIIANFFGMLFGAMDGSFNRCDPFFSKRYHYIMPMYPSACFAERWITNKEEIIK